MDSKRCLTESMRETAAATDQSPLGSGAEKELAFSLRNIGARVRQSVYQGYQTPPASCAKTQSTGSIIFRSVNDTLRDVRGDSSLLSSSFDPSRKRPLSPDCDEDEKEKMDETISDVLPCPHASTTRPTKPLRKPKYAFLRAHSLPTIPPKHLQQTSTEFEEEDWSHAQGPSGDQLFKPMDL